MLQIYLDESERVCIDTTGDGHIAREAASGRNALKMADNLERLVMAWFDVAILQGRNTAPLYGALGDIWRLRVKVRTKVVNRHQ